MDAVGPVTSSFIFCFRIRLFTPVSSLTPSVCANSADLQLHEQEAQPTEVCHTELQANFPMSICRVRLPRCTVREMVEGT